MKKLISILFYISLFSVSCKKLTHVFIHVDPLMHYVIKVHYCNDVSWPRDTVFEITSNCYPRIETFKEALPVIYRPNDSKIINVCDFDVLRMDTLHN